MSYTYTTTPQRGPTKEQLLAEAGFSVGEGVEILRGKYRGSVGKIVLIDTYWQWAGYNHLYIGYHVEVGSDRRRYREGSLRTFELTDETIDAAKTSLLQILQDLSDA